MNLEIYFVRSKQIIQFCQTYIIENVDDSTDIDDFQELDTEKLPPAASIDIYVTYMFVIAIVLGFIYFKRLNLKS